ncbi:MAG: hypothetical protein A2Z97_05130 [Bdellovibrionales bacterium GWB1_52_6]|nr:MAG: hypothetical protein A2Z97_05130 [Bdellovibrionales bacterium GWB1_52_6]
MVLFCALGLLVSSPLFGAETDQYTGRKVRLEDARETINRRVNALIRRTAQGWRGPRDDYRFAKEVRKAVDGFVVFNKFNKWIGNNPEIDHLNTRPTSIYRNIPFYKTIVPVSLIVAETVFVNGNRVGLDKFSHMFTVGWNSYKKYRIAGESAANEYDAGTERGLLGLRVSGVYSNADLVADFEGRHFYQSLSEDEVIPGKDAIIAWEGDYPHMQRAFDIADHVNAFWDESINTNQYRKGLAQRVLRNLRALCTAYVQSPEYWDITPDLDSHLLARYSSIGLWKNSEYRLAAICR